MNKFRFDDMTEFDAILRAISESDDAPQFGDVDEELGIYRPANGWLN